MFFGVCLFFVCLFVFLLVLFCFIVIYLYFFICSLRLSKAYLEQSLQTKDLTIKISFARPLRATKYATDLGQCARGNTVTQTRHHNHKVYFFAAEIIFTVLVTVDFHIMIDPGNY